MIRNEWSLDPFVLVGAVAALALLALGPSTPHVQSLDAADESSELERGRVDLIRLGGIAFDRATFEPGWRWSEHAGHGGAVRSGTSAT